ncbi:MAG TPA: AMP-binding protein [Acidimicrobiales bacterium]|nr:AMP-binding protein [Acidimicrobiales bacterium]
MNADMGAREPAPHAGQGAVGHATSYGARLHQLARAAPNEVAVVLAAEGGEVSQHTRAELDDRSTQLARVLARRGLGVGDRLAIQLPNSVELVIGCFAGWKLGATVIPMRWDLPDWEARRVREVAAPVVVLEPGSLGLFEEAQTQPAEPFEFATSPIAQGICSSGATGTPKVILRKTPAIWPQDARSTAIQESYGPLPTAAQRTLVCGPMYHTNGFTALSDLLSGFSTVIMGRFDAARAVELVERFRPTGMVAATSLLQRIAQVPDVRRRDLSSLQWVLQGASPLPRWVADTWIDLVGAANLYLIYGSTEATGVVAIRGDEYLEHPGSLGKGIQGTRVKILGPAGEELEPYEVGEIYLRPGNGVLVHEYLGDVPQTPVTPDGYTTVGDLGWLDEDGYLFLADRRVDLIKSGGANVFPAEVEVALSEHPGIADVAVIGLSDPEWGKRVHAIVQPRDPAAPPSPADVIAFAKARLAPYKVPKTVELVERVPRSEAGKVSRQALVHEREGSR